MPQTMTAIYLTNLVGSQEIELQPCQPAAWGKGLGPRMLFGSDVAQFKALLVAQLASQENKSPFSFGRIQAVYGYWRY